MTLVLDDRRVGLPRQGLSSRSNANQRAPRGVGRRKTRPWQLKRARTHVHRSLEWTVDAHAAAKNDSFSLRGERPEPESFREARPVRSARVPRPPRSAEESGPGNRQYGFWAASREERAPPVPRRKPVGRVARYPAGNGPSNPISKSVTAGAVARASPCRNYVSAVVTLGTGRSENCAVGSRPR